MGALDDKNKLQVDEKINKSKKNWKILEKV